MTAEHVMKKALRAVVSVTLLCGISVDARAHERETTTVNWGQTISRIMIEGCGSCHREGGSAFSLMTYDDARPWAVAIRDVIMERTMPPWGAVKGFGEFRNDQGLSPAQTNLIISWVEGGVPEGNDADLPEEVEFEAEAEVVLSPDALIVRGTEVLDTAMTLDGIWPQEVPRGASIQIFAELPDGPAEPLLWLYEYNAPFNHPFLLKSPLSLPAGTVIRGVPQGASIALMPSTSTE
jgi:hypothetical protein